MGAKTWMLVYSDGDAAKTLKSKPALDRAKTEKMVKTVFAGQKLTVVDEDVDLSMTDPPSKHIYAGCYGDVFIIAHDIFCLDLPSKLFEVCPGAKFGNTLQLHTTYSVVDFFAYGVWKDGKLQRSLSMSANDGILEDIGEKAAFEIPYWNGEHPVYDPEDEDDEDNYPFVFHPLDMGQAALESMFGYVLEGTVTPDQIEPEEFPLMVFKQLPWWKFW